MPHLHDLTIKKFHEGLLNKEFTAAEIVKAYFEFLKKKISDFTGKIKEKLAGKESLKKEPAEKAIPKEPEPIKEEAVFKEEKPVKEMSSVFPR